MKTHYRMTICENCGHYYFLHTGQNEECEACDSPEVPIDKRCPQFKSSDSSSRLEEKE